MGNASNIDTTESRYKAANTLLETLVALETNIKTVLEEKALEGISKLLGVQYAVWYRYSSDTETLEATATFAYSSENLPQTSFNLGEGLPGQVAKMKAFYEVEDASSNPNLVFTLIPVLSGQRVWGVWQLATSSFLNQEHKTFLKHCSLWVALRFQAWEAQHAFSQDKMQQTEAWQTIEREREELSLQKEAIRYNYERLQQLETLEKERDTLAQQVALNQSAASVAPANKTSEPEPNAEVEKLQQELNQRTSQWDGQRSRLLEQIAQLEQQLNEVKSERETQNSPDDTLLKEKTELEVQLQSSRKEVDLLKEQLADAQRKSTEESSAPETEVAQRLAALKAQHEQQRAADAEKLAETQRKVQELTEALRNASSTTPDDTSKLQKQLEEATQRIGELEAQLSQGIKPDKPVEGSSPQEEIIAAYEQKLEAFSQKVAAYRQQITEEHQAEIQEYERRLSEVNTMLEKVQAERQTTASQQETTAIEVKTLQEKVAILQKELHQKDEALEAAKRQQNTEAQMSSQLDREELLEYEHKLSSALQLAQEYREQLREAEATVEMLKRQIR